MAKTGVRLNLPLPTGDWDSIRGVALKLSGGQYGNLPAEAFQPQNEKNSAGFNQKFVYKPEISISHRYEIRLIACPEPRRRDHLIV